MRYVLTLAVTLGVLFSIHSAIPMAQGDPASAGRFTRLVPVTIINSTTAFPGGRYDVENIVEAIGAASIPRMAKASGRSLTSTSANPCGSPPSSTSTALIRPPLTQQS